MLKASLRYAADFHFALCSASLSGLGYAGFQYRHSRVGAVVPSHSLWDLTFLGCTLSETENPKTEFDVGVRIRNKFVVLS